MLGIGVQIPSPQHNQMEKIKITMQMLEKEGRKILGAGKTTDKELGFYGWGDKEELKFVVSKGYINDWCVYVESMNEEQEDYDMVKKFGNKLHPETAKILIDCSAEVLERYRL